MNFKQRLKNEFPNLNTKYFESFEKYNNQLHKFSKILNLVSPKTLLDTASFHFSDSIHGSLIIMDQCPSDFKEIYDFGSGNGFPGIIFAILNPETKVVLVERDLRKGEFLKDLVTVLNLLNCVVLSKDLSLLEANSIKYAMARGFASIDKASALSSPLFKDKGVFFHFKGDHWSKEVQALNSEMSSQWRALHIADYPLLDRQYVRSIVQTTILKSNGTA